MIHRGIGVAIGAIVTLILLVLFGPAGGALDDYVVPIVIGALVAFAWPIVIVWWLGRRARQRQQARIEQEVQRQMDRDRR